MHLAASNRKLKEERLKLGGCLLLLTVGAYSIMNRSRVGSLSSSVVASGIQVLPAFLLGRPQQVRSPRLAPSGSSMAATLPGVTLNNTQRKERAICLPLFVRTKKCFPEASSRLFWHLIGLESILCLFLNNHWQD